MKEPLEHQIIIILVIIIIIQKTILIIITMQQMTTTDKGHNNNNRKIMKNAFTLGLAAAGSSMRWQKQLTIQLTNIS